MNPFKYQKFKWLNLRSLADIYAANIEGDFVEDVYYFTAFASWSPEKVSRHQAYINALEDMNVKVVLGEFKRKTKRCNNCKLNFVTYEEKQTDVNIAVTLFRLAVEDKYDKVIIISGDTDILPAIRLVQSTFPEKKVGVIVPIGRESNSLRATADFRYKMRESHLEQAQFADRHVLKNGKAITRPQGWV